MIHRFEILLETLILVFLLGMAKEYMPEWVSYILLAGVVLVLMLNSIPYKKENPYKKKHYWLYNSVRISDDKMVLGVMESKKPVFSLSETNIDLNNYIIVHAIEIDKESYSKIKKAIDNRNKKKDE